MNRIILLSILLIVGLAGCNLPQNPDESGPAVPTNEAPIISTVVGTSTPAEIVPIPSSSIQIEGVPYTAYQIPGDPFRFVCQEPCPLDLQYIYAEYAGFRVARAKLIELTGIDTLSELQPVDMHLVLEDSICSELPAGHAYVYEHTHQAYTCTDGPGFYPTIEEKIQMAGQFESQYFTLHEYMHTFFFGRISGNAGNFQDYKAEFMHDFVVPIPSYAVGILDSAQFCSYRNDLAPGDYGGWLISELCQQNGFQLADLARGFIELDKQYQAGKGQVAQAGYEHPALTIAQFRDALDQVLGSDTTGAFANACWPAEFFGNSYSVPAACVLNSTNGVPTPVK